MEKTIKVKHEVVVRFFKEAFCVDGEVRLCTSQENAELLAKKKIAFIKLMDSKRGTFFIGKVL